MKNIATDLSSIDELVNAGCVYVDKTAHLHRMITSASKLYLEWYDNYRFSNKNDLKVLNPISVGLSLSRCEFDRYWNSI